MSAEEATFLIVSAIALTGAANAVLQRKPLRSLIGLMVTALGLTAAFILLGAYVAAGLQLALLLALGLLIRFTPQRLTGFARSARSAQATPRRPPRRWLPVLIATLGLSGLMAWELFTYPWPVVQNAPSNAAPNPALPIALAGLILLVAAVGLRGLWRKS